MVKSMVERGVPIDGVGLQMHLRVPDTEPSLAELEENMQRIAALGLEVLISELDVRLCNGETEAQQVARFHDVVALCVRQPRCPAVTFWGLSDRDSWLNVAGNPGCPGGELPHGLLWDDNYTKKPAYYGVMDALTGR
jgi:endo-1,4-beta-xylanase